MTEKLFKQTFWDIDNLSNKILKAFLTNLFDCKISKLWIKYHLRSWTLLRWPMIIIKNVERYNSQIFLSSLIYIWSPTNHWWVLLSGRKREGGLSTDYINILVLSSYKCYINRKYQTTSCCIFSASLCEIRSEKSWWILFIHLSKHFKARKCLLKDWDGCLNYL